MIVTDVKTKYIIGEDTIISNLTKIMETENSFLINLYGDEGSGKSTFLEYFQELESLQCELLQFEDGDLNYDFQDDRTILMIDDVDHYISKEQFRNVLINIFSTNPHVKVIYTSTSKFFNDTLPGINNFNFEIGNRVFNYDEFKRFTEQDKSFSILSQGCEIPEKILKNIYLFATYCRNFHILNDVYRSITDVVRKQGSIEPQQFIQVLTSSELFSKMTKDLVIDTQNVEDSDYFFVVRTKDKIEKLRDILLKYYPQENVIFEVMRNQYDSSFIEETFNRKIPYPDKLLNICLTFDPVELLVKLLGPRDIILELHELRMGEASFTYSIEDKAKLILKNIGMIILDDSKSVHYFYDRFKTNYDLLTGERNYDMSREYLIGLGISCFQDVEQVFYEMLNFYATYFSGSLSNYLHEYNAQQNGKKILDKRITFGQYINLFRYMNKFSKQQGNQIKLLNLERKEVIPNKLITMIENLSSYRSFFSHFQKVAFEVPYKTYKKRVVTIYEQAIKLFDSLINEQVFPEIIKIKQVIFDEFGRKLFVASDWKKTEIRFCMSGQFANIDIYSHYYILRKQQLVAINPILIPRYLEDNRELFNGDGYDKSSETQAKQGATLINYVQPKEGAKILDVGCGNGKTTIELFQKHPDVKIDAFDLSESMIKKAIDNRQLNNIPENAIHFFTMDAMQLTARNEYDMVFSNAALHWMVDSNTMYTKLYDSLKPGGRLAVHQGGYNSYVGLHDMVKKAIDELDLHMYYQNWTYPIFYPTKIEFENLLRSIGFKNVVVKSLESDGSEFPNLVENFANAGMLPYINQLPEEQLKDKLRRKYFELCKNRIVDTYTHRLYAFADKGRDK